MNSKATSSDLRLLAGLVLLAQGALLLLGILDGSWHQQQAPFPFVWRDVAFVHVACALPLAVLLAERLRRRSSSARVVAAAAVLLGLSGALLVGAFRVEIMSAMLVAPAVGLLLRCGLALGLALSALLAGIALAGRPPANEGRSGRAALLLGLVAMLALPWTYVDARCRHDIARLGELVEQARVGEAHRLAYGLVLLDAGLKFQGIPLPQAALQLDQRVRRLEASTARALPVYATHAQRTERARTLAMLGRTSDALDVLASIPDGDLEPEVENLRGTIHEASGDWGAAAMSFQRAYDGWQARPASAERSAGLVHAARGMAFCRRKRGDYAAAEAAYQTLLSLAPKEEKAATHLLLAKFYEDAQEAEKSRAHARWAVEMDARLAADADRLIHRLTSSHFGCLGVYAAESQRAGH